MEIVVASWQQHRETLQHIRHRVFIKEQGIAERDEWDDDDLHATHMLAYDGPRPIGCARLLSNGTFGRLAILPDYRGQGWGSRLLHAVEKHAVEHLHWRQIRACAQVIAYDFYRAHGYHADSEFFWEAGICHIRIIKTLGRSDSTNEQYVLGQDTTPYLTENDACTAGYLQMATLGASREILMSIAAFDLSLWRDRQWLEALSRFLRQSRQCKLRLLVAEEYPTIGEHPLIQLQQRLSSRFQCRLYSGLEKDAEALFLPYGYLRLQDGKASACFSDRASTAKTREQFEENWKNSQSLREGRRLGI